jgi:hypothetical protein
VTVPFSKPKPGRNPLQRLSDQRRSLALAGLAIGAVGAAIFRRKRRGGVVDADFDAPTPTVAPPGVQPEFGPPAAVEVPLPASDPQPAGAPAPVAEPETEEEAPTAINAAPVTPVAAESAAATEPEPPASSEPTTGELNAAEASILAVLAQSGRTDDDRTAIAVATSLERETTDVADVLRKLSAEGVVSGELYTAVGDKIWAVTERGVRRLGAQS